MPTTPAGVRPLHRQPRRPRSRHHRIPDSDRSNVNTPDLNAATQAVAVAREVCRKAAGHLAELSSEDGRISVGKLDRHQGLAYDLGHAGALQARLACRFPAEPLAALVAKLVGREEEWGVSAMDLAPAGEFVNAH